nr:HAMP domain-containing protein [Gammaproteobacteria bacterium]
MRIGPKLLIAFLAVASLVAAVSYLTATIFTETLSKTENVCKGALSELVGASEMSLALHVSQVAAQDLLTDEHHARTASHDEVNPANNKTPDQRAVERNLNAFAKRLNDNSRAAASEARTSEQQGDVELLKAKKADVRRWLEQLASEYATHTQLMTRFLELTTKEQDIDRANDFLKTRLKAHYDKEMFPLVRGYQTATELELGERLRETERALTRAKDLSKIITFAAFLLAITFGIHISRSIAKPAHALTQAALRLGQGDLTTKLPVTSAGELGVLAATFNHMVSELRSTTVSKTYVDNIIHSMNEFLIVADASGRIETVNKTTLRELGYSADEMIGQSMARFIRRDAPPTPRPPADSHALAATGEYFVVAKNGGGIPAYWSSSELRNKSGLLQGMVYVGKDMSGWKRIEAQLRTSLTEKNVLLKEIHHRVKNNLQIICSLLALQARRSHEPATQAMFHESETRIRSMALIHEQLYRSQDIAQIDFATYVNELTRNLQRSYGVESHRITLRIAVDAIRLNIDEAIPCGLLINELVSNAIKHAFPGGQRGTISITFKSVQRQHVLSVHDNGSGPANAAVFSEGQSLGLQLVRALVKQLHGELHLEVEEGVQVTVTLPAASGNDRTA